MKKIIALSMLTVCLLAKISIADAQPAIKGGGSVMRVTGVDVFYKNGTALFIQGHQSKYSPVFENHEQEAKFHEKVYVDYKEKRYYSVANLSDGTTVANAGSFKMNSGFKIVGNDNVNGQECTVAKKTLDSKDVVIYYDQSYGFIGTPMPQLGVVDGVVVRIVVDGKTVIDVDWITQSTATSDLFPENLGRVVSKEEYDIAVKKEKECEKEVILICNGTIGIRDVTTENGGECPNIKKLNNGTTFIKKMSVPTTDNSRLTLNIWYESEKNIGTQHISVFALPTQCDDCKINQDNAQCDMVAENMPVPIELGRFILPDVECSPQQVCDDSANKTTTISVDVTEFASVLKGDVCIGVHTDTPNKQGGLILVDIDMHQQCKEHAVKNGHLIQLINTVPVFGQECQSSNEEEAILNTFKLDKRLKNARIVYTAKGGIDGSNLSRHSITFDGKQVLLYYPSTPKCTHPPLQHRMMMISSEMKVTKMEKAQIEEAVSTSVKRPLHRHPGLRMHHNHGMMMRIRPTVVPLGDLKAGEHTIEVVITPNKSDSSVLDCTCVSAYIIGEVVE